MSEKIWKPLIFYKPKLKMKFSPSAAPSLVWQSGKLKPANWYGRVRYKDIAESLFISERIVDKHMQNIFKKVESKNKFNLLNKITKGVASAWDEWNP